MFNLPNQITLIRIILIPVLLGLLFSNLPNGQWLAVPVFAIMAATDGLDGYIARINKQETSVGKFLDPLADKLVITACLVSFVELRQLPAWIAIIIISREFLVSGLRIMASMQGKDIPASPLGKYKTFFQIVAIFFWIVKVKDSLPIITVTAWITIIIALALTIYSGFDYFLNFKERIST